MSDRKRVRIFLDSKNNEIVGIMTSDEAYDLCTQYNNFASVNKVFDVKFAEREHCYINSRHISAIIID